MTAIIDVFIVTSSGVGHLLPCIELCKHLSSINYTSTLVIPTAVNSAELHRLGAVIQITSPTRSEKPTSQMGSELESHLSARCNAPEPANPALAVIDFQMGWTKHIFWKFKIPVFSFFTFGACAAAMEWGAWKSPAGDVHPGGVHLIPGLPQETHLTYQDLARKFSHPPHAAGGGGPPRPGDQPPWVPLVEGSTALMFNTCDDLERSFMDYLANQMGLPVLGVGPLSNSSNQNVLIRQPKNQTSYSDDQVLEWLDKKAQKSVLYVAFGSEVTPTREEHVQLASALEEMARPFVWVLQNDPKNESVDLDEKIGDRGLIIRGWAPQTLILSHSSIGGFLSHCGWNSTLEAMGRGVPILAWPIRGDQIYNAKLVVNYLKIGYMALSSGSPEMVKDDLKCGIGKIMRDQDVREQADKVRTMFHQGFPNSSKVALNGLKDLVENRGN